jgi:5-(carboxyamino)imidazole ribonucleotide mutase
MPACPRVSFTPTRRSTRGVQFPTLPRTWSAVPRSIPASSSTRRTAVVAKTTRKRAAKAATQPVGGVAPFDPAVRVGIAMGSASDWDTMRAAAEILEQFGVAFDARVVSAHRMPDAMFAYADAATIAASGTGLVALIAGAGGAAHLPGMLAAKTIVPGLGVPVPSKHLNGQDSLYSIVQMPKGIPVATFAIGSAGAANAALFAIAMLAAGDPKLAKKLATWREKQTRTASESQLVL